MTFPQQSKADRDERVQVHSHAPPKNVTVGGMVKGPDGTFAFARNAPELKDVAKPEKEVEAPPPVLMRIVEDKLASPREGDRIGSRTYMRAGKIISSQHYDFEDLRRQGVKLAPVGEEIVPAASASPSLGEIAQVLKSMGLEVVPAGSKSANGKSSDELEAFRKERETLLKALAESEKARAEDRARLDEVMLRVEEMTRPDNGAGKRKDR